MSRRQDRRDARRAEFWAAKEADAGTSQAKALAAWDRLRSDINDLPASQANVAWRVVIHQLESAATGITHGELRSEVRSGFR